MCEERQESRPGNSLQSLLFLMGSICCLSGSTPTSTSWTQRYSVCWHHAPVTDLNAEPDTPPHAPSLHPHCPRCILLPPPVFQSWPRSYLLPAAGVIQHVQMSWSFLFSVSCPQPPHLGMPKTCLGPSLPTLRPSPGFPALGGKRTLTPPQSRSSSANPLQESANRPLQYALSAAQAWQVRPPAP